MTTFKQWIYKAKALNSHFSYGTQRVASRAQKNRHFLGVRTFDERDVSGCHGNAVLGV